MQDYLETVHFADPQTGQHYELPDDPPELSEPEDDEDVG